MKGSDLGALEEIVLLVVGNLSGTNEAYGIKIREELKSRCRRNISISTIHTTLHRLEKKGFLKSKYDSSHEERRAGRPKLIFTITSLGYDALTQIHTVRTSLWKGLALGMNVSTRE